jgi:hypothetical protein
MTPSNKNEPNWEMIYKSWSGGASGPWVSRFPVPGGWLYYIDCDRDSHVVFVPTSSKAGGAR